MKDENKAADTADNAVSNDEPTKQEKATAKKGRRKRSTPKASAGGKGIKKRLKWIIPGSILLLFALLIIVRGSRTRAALSNSLSVMDFTVLEYRTIQNAISATGTVESDDKTNVYSTLTYKVQSIPVSVGDYVVKDQVLLELDKSSIEQQIKEKELAMESSGQSSSQSVKSASDTYNNYKKSLEEGTNSSLISANNAVETAYDKYLSAITDYENYQDTLKNGGVTSVINAETNYNNAVLAYQTAEKAYNDANVASPPSPADIDKAKAALDKAKNDMQGAEDAYESAYRASRNAIGDYQEAIDAAYKAYENALLSLKAADVAAQNQLEAYKNSLRSAQISSNQALSDYQLEEMKKTLDDASIKAPVEGTVTAVYATVGASASGLMFVIEDTKNLIVKTTVKEFDIGTVKEGLSVAIKSDATGDDVFDGIITTIAPTANKNAQGSTDTTGDIQFASEVKVIGTDTPLRIGMSVRLEYILEKEAEVFAVPYDAVYKNQSGDSCVLAAMDIGKDKTRLTEIIVQTGMENDLDIVITGEGLTPGLKIINTPANYTAGAELSVSMMRTNGNSVNPGGGLVIGNRQAGVRQGG